MEAIIHKTLTDELGRTYKVVSSQWLRALTAVAVINFIVLIAITAVLIENSQSIQNTMNFTAKVAQRNAASAEVAESRLKANMWAFQQACEAAKRHGEVCMEAVWYADPAKYPLIANDPTGAGVFPPK